MVQKTPLQGCGEGVNVTFDWNEWYFIITSSVGIGCFLFIRKYFPLIVVVIVWIYNVALVATIDYVILATPFKLYYFGDNRTYELSGALYHFIMYPCASLLFLYVYDSWKLSGIQRVLYILCWTTFALFIEWMSVKNHALTYTGWRLYYSIPVYPLTALLLIVLFNFVKKQLEALSPQKSTNR